VNGGQTADDYPISNFHVSAQGNAVCHDHVVADNAVMRYVRVSHEKTIAPNGCLAALDCSAIERYELANHGPLANLQNGWLAFILQVLRRASDGCSLVDLAITTKARAIVDSGVGPDPRSVPNHYIILNNGVRAYVNIFSKVGFWTDNCMRIDLNRHQDEEVFLLMEDN
jgi:hypothetical protein